MTDSAMGFFSPLGLLLFLFLDAGSPLPDATTLRQRVIDNMRRSDKMVERYSCVVNTRTQRLDDSGQSKKEEFEQAERFYVNGVRIDHVLARNGKELTGSQAKDEQNRTDKQVKKYANPDEARKFQDNREKQFDMFLRAQRLTNGHRESRNGRSLLVYDLAADPNFHAKSIEERFAQAAGGRVWIDEGSGALAELKVKTNKDVKIGGGLLANLHKGFELHLTTDRQPDGLWLIKMVEGNADVRAGLFFHPRIRFREDTSACHLFSVDSHDLTYGNGEHPPAGKASQ